MEAMVRFIEHFQDRYKYISVQRKDCGTLEDGTFWMCNECSAILEEWGFDLDFKVEWVDIVKLDADGKLCDFWLAYARQIRE